MQGPGGPKVPLEAAIMTGLSYRCRVAGRHCTFLLCAARKFLFRQAARLPGCPLAWLHDFAYLRNWPLIRHEV